MRRIKNCNLCVISLSIRRKCIQMVIEHYLG